MSKHHNQSVSELSSRLVDYFPQLRTLISRDFKLQSRDLTSLILNAVTAPAAALMLAIAANNRDIFKSSSADNASFADAQRILFVIVCSTIWVGLSSSLQSMVKERAIFKRERAFNLLPEAYLTSKVLVMIATSLLQSALLAIAVGCLFESPSSSSSEWPFRIGMAAFITLLSVGSQGLLVSSVVKNSQQASSIAPILLIPQLVFGGVLFNLTKNSEGIYYAVSSRWSMILMGCWSNITDLIPLPPGVSIDSSSIPGADHYENTTENVNGAIAVLIIQFGLFIATAILSLLFSRKNRQ